MLNSCDEDIKFIVDAAMMLDDTLSKLDALFTARAEHTDECDLGDRCAALMQNREEA